MSARTRASPPPRIVPLPTGADRPWRLVERNVLAYRRTGTSSCRGFVEPLLFLLSIGIGVGKLVGDRSRSAAQSVSYRTFVAPGLLAIAAMIGALLDTTFNFFVKYKYSHTYDAIVATPLTPVDVATGEITWALIRGAIYSTAFLLDDAAVRARALVVGVARGARRGADRVRLRRRSGSPPPRSCGRSSTSTT